MKILMAHPTGNSNVRAVLHALAESAMLAEFNTTIAVDTNGPWRALFGKKLTDQLLRRNYQIPAKMLKSHPLREFARITFPRIRLGSLTAPENSWASIDSVYRNLDKRTARRIKINSSLIDGYYGYEDGALASFKIAKELGLTCIYDLPIAYWETGRKLMQEEADRLPEWARTLGGGINDSEQKLERKTKEMELADIVITPGDFVKNSLPKWAAAKTVVVAPFGSPACQMQEAHQSPSVKAKKLRILFVGSMSQRKGLGDLFNAFKLLQTCQIELIVMGSLQAPLAFYKSQLSSFTYMSNRPHHQVLELMQSCDILCLPSIVEGRALVMQEAMSQGLPIIITANTGGSDLIVDEQTGFLVPIRSPQVLAEKLEWFLCNKRRISEMGAAAKAKASTYTWEAYGATIVSALREHA